jgi:hypothetical protein
MTGPADPTAARTARPATGYRHPDFARSFQAFAEPVFLGRSGGALLARRIPGTALDDAIGPYPLFACADYAGLADDLRDLPDGIIAVSAVVDPFADAAPELAAAFDFCRAYKPHHVADLQVPFADYMHRHHRRYSKRALAAVAVERASQPQAFTAEWSALYAGFCARRGIGGLRALSEAGFRLQLGVPGAHYFRALADGECVGGLVCMLDDDVAYAHLIATTPRGQELLAQYALYWHAIEHFRAHARWFNLGATPGTAAGQAPGGLDAFKAGWATGAKSSWFCGKVRDRARYDALCPATPADAYFPAYREAAAF